jgi:serine/threonine-protein kinase
VRGLVLAQRFELLAPIGRGGMGAVWEAEDRTRPGHRVAIKLLRHELSEDEHAARRFEREAFAAAAARHPGIVPVISSGREPDGTAWMAMERVEGRSMLQCLKEDGVFSPERIARLAAGALRALAAAHAVGVIHRDVKPSNVMVIRAPNGERAQILDFGVAKLMETAGWTRLTSTGAVLGTPAYMAPEQLAGRPVDHRCDLYAMGALMHHALTGRVPFPQLEPADRLKAILSGPPLTIHRARPDLDPALAAIVDRALDREPDRRFPDANAMADALGAFYDDTADVSTAAFTPQRPLPAPLTAENTIAPPSIALPIAPPSIALPIAPPNIALPIAPVPGFVAEPPPRSDFARRLTAVLIVVPAMAVIAGLVGGAIAISARDDAPTPAVDPPIPPPSPAASPALPPLAGTTASGPSLVAEHPSCARYLAEACECESHCAEGRARIQAFQLGSSVHQPDFYAFTCEGMRRLLRQDPACAQRLPAYAAAAVLAPPPPLEAFPSCLAYRDGWCRRTDAHSRTRCRHAEQLFETWLPLARSSPDILLAQCDGMLQECRREGACP